MERYGLKWSLQPDTCVVNFYVGSSQREILRDEKFSQLHREMKTKTEEIPCHNKSTFQHFHTTD